MAPLVPLHRARMALRILWRLSRMEYRILTAIRMKVRSRPTAELAGRFGERPRMEIRLVLEATAPFIHNRGSMDQPHAAWARAPTHPARRGGRAAGASTTGQVTSGY